MNTDNSEAMRLADLFELEPDPDSLYRQAAALLRQQSERIAELEAERDRLREEVERYHHLRNGQGWPAVFASHDAPEPIRGDELDAAIDAARTTHKETE